MTKTGDKPTHKALMKRKAPVEPEPSRKTAKMATRTPPSLADPNSTQSIVRILVGDEATEFKVFKDFLCFYSPYFAAALQPGNFEEGVNQCITLSHISVDVFGYFVAWLYTQKVEFTSLEIADEADENQLAWDTLIDIWLLSDYLQVPELQNVAIRLFHQKVERINDVPTYRYCDIFENTTPQSKLRKIIVDFCVWRPFKDSSVFQDSSEFPEEVVREIAAAFNSRCLRIFNDDPMLDPLDDITNYYVRLEEN